MFQIKFYLHCWYFSNSLIHVYNTVVLSTSDDRLIILKLCVPWKDCPISSSDKPSNQLHYSSMCKGKLPCIPSVPNINKRVHIVLLESLYLFKTFGLLYMIAKHFQYMLSSNSAYVPSAFLDVHLSYNWWPLKASRIIIGLQSHS